MDVADRIMGVESGGDPTARNSLSSAGGLGQFIDPTWLAMVAKYRPDLASSMSREDLLALKTDPNAADLQRDMTRRYVAENSQYLQQNGFEPNATNVYLAHFAGPAGATNILGSDPGTPIADVMGQKAVAANPWLRGMTAGDVVSWAGRKMGGAEPMPLGPPQTATGSRPGILAQNTTPAPTGLLGASGADSGTQQGLLAQRQPGQPQATQDDGPMGLLQPQAVRQGQVGPRRPMAPFGPPRTRPSPRGFFA